MATRIDTAGGPYAITADDLVMLNCPSGEFPRIVGGWLVQIVDTGSLVVSITVKGRAAGSTLTPVLMPYRKLYLNGAVADGSLVSTAITGTSLIIIPASGIDAALDVDWTSGTGTITAVPLMGSPSV